jgi:hypothetical protein
MNIELSEEAAEFGRLSRQALEAAGGDQLAVLAEQEPARRESLVAPVLGELGAWILDPRGDASELEAAAALCRSAGYWAAPYPVAERLSRPADLDADGLVVVVVADSAPAAAVTGLDLRWAAVTLAGRRSMAVARPPVTPPRASAFVTALDLEPVDHDGAKDAALGLVLPCWTLLGMPGNVGGRPGLRRLLVSYFLAASLRCQASSVAGVTGKTSVQRLRGMSRASAANHTRSAGSYRTRPAWRRSTAFSGRSTSSSASFAKSLRNTRTARPSSRRISR